MDLRLLVCAICVSWGSIASAQTTAQLANRILNSPDRRDGLTALVNVSDPELAVALARGRTAIVHAIHDDANVSGVLELRRQRRAVDDFETRLEEVVPNEREGVHVGGVIVGIAPRHGVSIAPVHGEAALAARQERGGRRDQFARQDALQPQAAVLGEALGGFLILSFQRQIDVVVIDKHRCQNGS